MIIHINAQAFLTFSDRVLVVRIDLVGAAKTPSYRPPHTESATNDFGPTVSLEHPRQTGTSQPLTPKPPTKIRPNGEKTLLNRSAAKLLARDTA